MFDAPPFHKHLVFSRILNVKILYFSSIRLLGERETTVFFSRASSTYIVFCPKRLKAHPVGIPSNNLRELRTDQYAHHDQYSFGKTDAFEFSYTLLIVIYVN